MEKFLLLPTPTGQQTISATGIFGISQSSTTVVNITYGNSVVLQITHTIPTKTNAMRDLIRDSIFTALSTGWTSPSFVVNIPATIVTSTGDVVTITDSDFA